MADISAIKPTGTSGASYNIKDATARTNIGTLNNNVSALGGRVTGLDTRVTALEKAGGGQRTYFSSGYSDDPESEYGFTDCGYALIVDATRWLYDDDDKLIQKTFRDTWSYYNSVTDALERVGTPKVGDLIFVKEVKTLDNWGLMPTNEIIGKFNTTSLDSHYTRPTPPSPSEDIDVWGSGNNIHLGNSYYATYKAFYIVGFATVNVPSEEVEGKTDTLLIAKCFDTEA